MAGPTAADACERSIRRRILRGELAPGERLPPERALAEELGVNRTTLRAALGRLASARLLHVRQGSGYVVQDYARVAGLELLPELTALLDPPERAAVVGDLLAVRRRLASLVFERIAGGADPALADRVDEAVRAFAAAVERGADLEAIADADLEVTAALLGATGSRVLQLCLNPVSFVVRELPALRREMYAEPETNVRAYRVLVAWLRDPRPEAVAGLEAVLAERDARTVARMRGA